MKVIRCLWKQLQYQCARRRRVEHKMWCDHLPVHGLFQGAQDVCHIGQDTTGRVQHGLVLEVHKHCCTHTGNFYTFFIFHTIPLSSSPSETMTCFSVSDLVKLSVKHYQFWDWFTIFLWRNSELVSEELHTVEVTTLLLSTTNNSLFKR